MEPAQSPWPQPSQQPPSPPYAAAPPPPSTPAHAILSPPAGTGDPLRRKSPKLAALLSVFPGLGNIYNGLYLRGFTFFAIFMGLIGMAEHEEVFVAAIMFFGLFNIIDAYRQATLINYGYAQDLGILDMPEVPKAGQGGIIAGVVLTLIGLFALLERFFSVNLEFLFDLWPAALMLIGLWLVVSSVRERLKDRDQAA
ncbi:MAG TPA: DUF5668 domain-containing protein [Thermoanaerobaculia bacterium]|nr:DUF5668 domain-containing protein [Thermoanaerobaculia bacterium]